MGNEVRHYALPIQRFHTSRLAQSYVTVANQIVYAPIATVGWVWLARLGGTCHATVMQQCSAYISVRSQNPTVAKEARMLPELREQEAPSTAYCKSWPQCCARLFHIHLKFLTAYAPINVMPHLPQIGL